MRPRFAWLVVAVGILLVIVAAAAVGNRDNSDKTVPAGEWTHDVCLTVVVWRGAIESIVEDIRTPSSAAPRGTPQGRTGLVRSGLERAVLATETMVEGIDNAGIPAVSLGEQSAEQVSSWATESLHDLKRAEESLGAEAETPEEGVQQLASALNVIGTVVASGGETLAEVARDHPELANASRDSSACNDLREEASAQ